MIQDYNNVIGLKNRLTGFIEHSETQQNTGSLPDLRVSGKQRSQRSAPVIITTGLTLFFLGADFFIQRLQATKAKSKSWGCYRFLEMLKENF